MELRGDREGVGKSGLRLLQLAAQPLHRPERQQIERVHQVGLTSRATVIAT